MQHGQILVGTLLHLHRMAEEPADHPGVDVGLGRFGEQKPSARSKHAPEFVQSPFLFDQMMEGLMAEHDVDGRIGKFDAGAIPSHEFHCEVFMHGFPACRGQAARVGVEAEHSFRSESVPKQAEGFPLAATRIEQGAALDNRFADQPLEIIDRHPQHVMLPGMGGQEAKADATFFDVGGAGVVHGSAGTWPGCRVRTSAFMRGWMPCRSIASTRACGETSCMAPSARRTATCTVLARVIGSP